MSTYLNRARGTGASASEVVIATGFAQALHLLARTLRSRGARRIGVEDPWQPESRAMVDRAGLQTVPIPVDERGINVEALDAANVDAVVVTPAHQYPTGAVLPAERRAALIAWADRRDATIIEDDYDSEFRYDREPIGAMQGLCAERVVYAGTASKILAPGLRLGWIVAPSRIAADIAHVKMAADHGSAALDQLALADFIERGELDRHLRRMRDASIAADATCCSKRSSATCRRSSRAARRRACTCSHWLPDEIDEAGARRAGGSRRDRARRLIVDACEPSRPRAASCSAMARSTSARSRTAWPASPGSWTTCTPAPVSSAIGLSLYWQRIEYGHGGPGMSASPTDNDDMDHRLRERAEPAG